MKRRWKWLRAILPNAVFEEHNDAIRQLYLALNSLYDSQQGVGMLPQEEKEIDEQVRKALMIPLDGLCFRRRKGRK